MMLLCSVQHADSDVQVKKEKVDEEGVQVKKEKAEEEDIGIVKHSAAKHSHAPKPRSAETEGASAKPAARKSEYASLFMLVKNRMESEEENEEGDDEREYDLAAILDAREIAIDKTPGAPRVYSYLLSFEQYFGEYTWKPVSELVEDGTKYVVKLCCNYV